MGGEGIGGVIGREGGSEGKGREGGREGRAARSLSEDGRYRRV